MAGYDLSEAERRLIEPLLPKRAGRASQELYREIATGGLAIEIHKTGVQYQSAHETIAQLWDVAEVRCFLAAIREVPTAVECRAKETRPCIKARETAVQLAAKFRETGPRLRRGQSSFRASSRDVSGG